MSEIAIVVVDNRQTNSPDMTERDLAWTLGFSARHSLMLILYSPTYLQPNKSFILFLDIMSTEHVTGVIQYVYAI